MSTLYRTTDRRFPPHPRRKLTPDQVAEIRESVEPGPALAKRYGVSSVTIWNVRHGVCYRELGGLPGNLMPFKPEPAETPHYE